MIGVKSFTGSYGRFLIRCTAVTCEAGVAPERIAVGRRMRDKREPIEPLAPLRLSTITLWPSESWSLAATSRAIMSTEGPGGTGTTMVMGLAAGQLCAEASPVRGEDQSPRRMSAMMARQVFTAVRLPTRRQHVMIFGTRC